MRTSVPKPNPRNPRDAHIGKLWHQRVDTPKDEIEKAAGKIRRFVVGPDDGWVKTEMGYEVEKRDCKHCDAEHSVGEPGVWVLGFRDNQGLC